MRRIEAEPVRLVRADVAAELVCRQPVQGVEPRGVVVGLREEPRMRRSSFRLRSWSRLPAASPIVPPT
jgi:hypothetical protein